MRLTCGCRVVDEKIGKLHERMLVVLFGPAGSGKTTLSLQYALSALSRGLKVLYVNTEDPMFIDRLYRMADRRGVKFNTEHFHVFEARDFKIQHRIVTRIIPVVAGAYKLIVVDSLTGLFRLEAGESSAEKVLKMLNLHCLKIIFDWYLDGKIIFSTNQR